MDARRCEPIRVGVGGELSRAAEARLWLGDVKEASGPPAASSIWKVAYGQFGRPPEN